MPESAEHSIVLLTALERGLRFAGTKGEIEEVLNMHPSVKASAVVGKQDDMRGEVPIAFVEIEEDAEFNDTELRNFVRDAIAQYKVPREVRQIDELPRNPTGKILRRELKV